MDFMADKNIPLALRCDTATAAVDLANALIADTVGRGRMANLSLGEMAEGEDAASRAWLRLQELVTKAAVAYETTPR